MRARVGVELVEGRERGRQREMVVLAGAAPCAPVAGRVALAPRRRPGRRMLTRSDVGDVSAPTWVPLALAVSAAVIGSLSVYLLKPGIDAAEKMQDRDRAQFGKGTVAGRRDPPTKSRTKAAPKRGR